MKKERGKNRDSMKQTKDYGNWVEQAIDGKPCKVNTATGEVREGYARTLYDGDIVITPEMREARRKYMEEQARKEEQKQTRRDISKKNGGHYFVPRLQEFPDLKPQTAARLIYLMTFADYTERGGRLRRTLKTGMSRDDLPKVLGLSKDAVDNFLTEVCPQYMEVTEDGIITVGTKAYHRGRLTNGQSYHRFYDGWVKSLYLATPKSRHRHLGYVFQMLPYISIEYNVLCYNPEETESKKIEYMRLGEFCDKIGFDRSHIDRLLKIYKNLRFEVKDESDTYTERFVSFVYDGLDHSNDKVFVNPRILYSGAHPKQVELLAGFSRD